MINLKLNIDTFLFTPLRPVLHTKRQTEDGLEKRLKDDYLFENFTIRRERNRENI